MENNRISQYMKEDVLKGSDNAEAVFDSKEKDRVVSYDADGTMTEKNISKDRPKSFDGLMIKVDVSAVCINPTEQEAIKTPDLLEEWLENKLKTMFKEAGFSFAEVTCSHRNNPFPPGLFGSL